MLTMNRLPCGIDSIGPVAIRPMALCILAIITLATETISLSAQTPPEITVEPRRVVFEGIVKDREIHLRSSAPDTLVYELVVVNYRMTEMGEFVETTSPAAGQLFADRMIQVTPKELTIFPRGEATIKVLYNRPADLADGEYRSHLGLRFIRRAATTTSAGSVSASSNQGRGNVIDIGKPMLDGEKIPPTPMSLDYDISIPIIVRQGSLSAKVTISYLNVDLATTGADSTSPPEAPFATTRLERTGTRSTYGDVSIWYVGEEAQRVQIGELHGIAIYTPNPLRRLRIPLTIPPGLVLAKGVLRIEYHEGGDAIIGELEVPVP